jgi:hypothetical protein
LACAKRRTWSANSFCSGMNSKFMKSSCAATQGGSHLVR